MALRTALGVAAASLISVGAGAHPGGLDAQGCHMNRKTGENIIVIAEAHLASRQADLASRQAGRRCKGSFPGTSMLARAALEGSALVHVAGGTASTRAATSAMGSSGAAVGGTRSIDHVSPL
jgi:hypothetical protein